MENVKMQPVCPGVFKISLGEPEQLTPVSLRDRQPAEELASMSAVAVSPIGAEGISGHRSRRGFVVAIDLQPEEQLYGLGVQMFSFNQRGLKKKIRVNSNPENDLGDSHAPAPFYVSTGGYGVLIDTARYATFYMGTTIPLHKGRSESGETLKSIHSEEVLYQSAESGQASKVVVDIPAAEGADVYLFGGPSMLEAVQRYVLFSGGGCMPPRWGLGIKFRAPFEADQNKVLALAEEMRDKEIPCSMIGLEPGWETHRYPSSYVWSDLFPEPGEFIKQLREKSYQLNLWVQVFADQSAPIYEALLPYCGDHEVWKGASPDLTLKEVRDIYTDLFGREHQDLGVTGYKLDECDNSDYNATPWSFPEFSEYPSGLDGEQMHMLVGMNYQAMVDDMFRKRNIRTYGDVRCSHALSAPYPFVLYSDTYDYRRHIQAIVNCGFSGHLWQPDIRIVSSKLHMARLLQLAVFSPETVLDGWNKDDPIWRREEWGNGSKAIPAEEQAALCRSILNLRMALLPYLYAAFARYRLEGIPPFRAVVMDYPDDEELWNVGDQLMVGDRILVAPILDDTDEREVYLPQGRWRHFFTGERYEGGTKILLTVPLEQYPVFVKDDSVLPLAQVTGHTEDPRSMELTVQVYGSGELPFTLYEDDGATFDFEKTGFNHLTLSWDSDESAGSEERAGTVDCPRYRVVGWDSMG
jgi:alpha-D-xyloside xylohydrolase